MKKIIFLVLGLLMVGLFLVGCSEVGEGEEELDEETLAGEATGTYCAKYEQRCGFVTEKGELECKQFSYNNHIELEDGLSSNTGDTLDDFCKGEDYDLCVGATGFSVLKHTETDNVFILPLPIKCNTEKFFDLEDHIGWVNAWVNSENIEQYPAEVTQSLDHKEFLSGVTCCRIN